MSRKLTKEEFIRRAKEIHGDFFDYSKVEYKNNHTKVCIICPVHGDFWQTPKSHLKGERCPYCRNNRISKSKTYTLDDFIKKAREVHGNFFIYSKVEYKNSWTKVCIICPIHGEFWTTPSNHLQGHNCPECAKLLRAKHRAYSFEEFIAKAREIHGDKYDYSKVDYKGMEVAVCIICPIHGEFWQKPCVHIMGSGCQKCGYEKVGKLCSFSTEDFIAKARLVHGDKYDYSNVDYKDYTTRVCIICAEHGEFWQRPSHHLAGCGCPKCAGHERMGIDLFIQKAIEMHGDKYDYSEVIYVNNHTKVCIICPIHGRFWQKPNSHLNGYGCPHCKESFGEKRVRLWLDKNGLKYKREYHVTPTQVLFGRNKFMIDFYLPDHNMFIEFHGEQHYRRVECWHTEEQFAEQQDRDRRLRDYCKQHGIVLIEIPYTEFDNIHKILSKKIKV